LIVTSASIDCDPLGSFATNKTLDVILVGNNYHDATIQKQELSAAAGIIALTEPFLSYYANPSQGINFYTINKLFETDDIQQIRTYAYSNCVYSSAFQKLVIILDKKNFECAQEEYTVRLNSPFSFNTTKASETTINEIVSDFCSYVNQLALMNPPVATILTQDMVTAPQQIPIDFKITDEEYPVDYELLFNYVTLIKSRVSDANVHQHVLNIPQGNWILQIKATDKRGNEGYSNILRIMTNDTITVDFSSLGTVSIPKGSSVNINLNSYADDPRNENIIEWVHEPAFSNCVEFNPVARITSGSVSLIATGNTGCQETIKFEVITASNRRGSGTMNIRVE
jgi:hypothetical protein